MTTLKDVRKLAATFGATVVDDKIGNTHECTCEAPKGMRWKCDELHMFVTCSYIPWKPDYGDLVARMKFGVEECPDPECDWCHPEDEE